MRHAHPVAASGFAESGERVREWANGRLADGVWRRYAGPMATLRIRDIAGTPRDGAIAIAAVTAVGAALALLGPFGTFLNGGLGVRLAYWIGLLWISMLFYLPSLWAGLTLSARLDLPPWFGLAAAILVASLPMAGAARFAARLVWTRFVGGMSPLDWYGETLIVALPLCVAYAGVKGLLRPQRSGALEPKSPATDEDEGEGSLRFLARLPPRLGRDLLCLQMEDHYVRAHTAAGSDLILIPLHQAVAELQGLEGLQVHRSWWVARRAVLEVAREGRSVRLKLRNGVTAPVSRRAVAALKAAAWME
jgi:hypothetical protein